MTTRLRVLLTGHLGYIGSVLVDHLCRAGHDVVGLDTGYFDECTLVPDRATVPTMRKDIRELVADDLRGVDAVVHLAALSNDPIGNLDEHWTREINRDATIRLAELARDAGAHRFLFSSSCIMYGAAEADVVDETSPLDPKTEYARSKVVAEQALRELASDSFSPTYVRNGTIYGLSPRMRFDTVLNDFVASAHTTGTVEVHGDGSPWRPVVHLEDVCRSFTMLLSAPLELVHDEAFNNGTDAVNTRILSLAEAVLDAVPGSELEVHGQPSADQRTYKADFGKLARTFPDFEFRYTPADGALELAAAFRSIGLTREQYESAKFTRLRWLNKLIDSGSLDGALRWTAVTAR